MLLHIFQFKQLSNTVMWEGNLAGTDPTVPFKGTVGGCLIAVI
jgi:hypothetical protein